jgi:hypothetical protein
VDQFWGQR